MSYLMKARSNIGGRVLSLVIGLLFLRIILFGIGGWLKPNLQENLWIIYQFGTYLLTVAFILTEYDNLQEYHFDRLSLYIILGIKPIMALYRLYTIYNSSVPNYWHERIDLVYLQLSFIIIGIFSILLLNRKDGLKHVKFVSIKWIFLSIFIGLVSSVFYSLALLSHEEIITHLSIRKIPILVLIQLTHAAVYEEPLFRGILWGVMKRIHIEDKWIWMVQALLFFVAHIYYLNLSIVHWALTFFGALVLGAVVWRTRSILTSMIAHSILNSLTLYFVAFFQTI